MLHLNCNIKNNINEFTFNSKLKKIANIIIKTEGTLSPENLHAHVHAAFENQFLIADDYVTAKSIN